MLHLVATAALMISGLLLSALPNVPSAIGTRPQGPQYPAPPGYLLPWAGGQIHDVTQGEETTVTHNGLAAYAFDFNLNYDTVVAARGGKVQFVRMNSNAGGCSAVYSHASNYVVIDHGDGTSALYLHLAYDSALVQPGQVVAQGEPIAVSGETGVTCTGIEGDLSPAPHLHFQVQRFDERTYFSQSLPVTFDDVKGDGIPLEGESYASGNYGPGKPQKIALTPRRVERVFNPQAQPADPHFLEAMPVTPTPEPLAPEAAPSDTPLAGDTPTETPTDTPTATQTPPPDTPTPTQTPPPAPTEAPATETAAPAPTETPEPSPPPAPTAELSPAAEPSPEPTAVP